MWVLDRRILAPLGRHEFRIHALGSRAPGGAVVLALPDATAGDRQGHVAWIARVEADGMDCRRLIAAAEPFFALGVVPQRLDQAPAFAGILGAEQPAADRSRPDRSRGLAKFQRPDF